MAFTPQWEEVQPQNRWQILRRQKRFALWALYSSIGSFMLGFDYGIAGTITAFHPFQRDFGIEWPNRPSGYLIPAVWQSAWSGATSAGGLFGALIAGYLIERAGRKHMMAIGAIIAGVGIAMQVASDEWKLFLGGRLVNAAGFSFVFLTCPIWIGENVRPELRGFFLCLTNGSIVLGQFILAVLAKATSSIDGRWSYEILVILQLVTVVLILIFYPFFPESAYFLLCKRNEDQARRSLNIMHGSGDQNLIEAELVRLKLALDFAENLRRSAKNNGPLIVQCFQGSNRKRTLIVILILASQQLIGANFVIGYITYFMALIRISHYFIVSIVLYVVMLSSNASAFYFAETVGRRTLLVSGQFVLTGILFVMGIMGVIDHDASTWVILVCIFLWAIVYQMGVGATGFVSASEISSLPLRPAAQSIIILTQLLLGWAVGFVTPYMINPDAGNLGGMVGFVFGGLGVPCSILFYFFIPETKGLSFEEMDHLFLEKTSCRHFQSAVRRRRAELGSGPKEVEGPAEKEE